MEAIYYRRPVLVSGYEIFRTDIEPKGFQVVSMDGFVTNDVIEQCQAIVRDPDLSRAMTERNYQLGRQYFSYAVLRRRIQLLLEQRFSQIV